MVDDVLKVLLIEDDEDDFILISSLLRDTTPRRRVEWVSDYESALEAMAKSSYDVCLLDYRLGEHDGLEILKSAPKGFNIPIVFLTGRGDYEVDLKAMKAGAADYLIKGQIDAQLLERSIRYAIRHKRVQEELREAYDELDARVRERTAELRHLNEQLVLEIEQHRKTESALRASEERYRRIVETAHEGIWVIDADRKINYVNRRMAELLGFSPDEVLGRSPDEFMVISSQSLALHHFQQQRLGVKEQYDLIFRRKNGQDLWATVSATPILNDSGEFIGALNMISDVSDTKQAEDAIQALMESTVGGIGQDFFDRVVASLCEWLGCECALTGEIVDGKTKVRTLSRQLDGAITHGHCYKLEETPCAQVVEQGYTAYTESVCRFFPDDEVLRQYGAEGYVGVPLKDRNGEAIGLLCALSRHRLDLPRRTEEVMHIIAAKASSELEHRRMEEEKNGIERQLHQAQKMEAIGTLAGGIAHDFNNILAVILGCAELAVEDVEQQSNVHRNLREVINASNRARDLVKQILTFSRMKDDQDPMPVLVSPIIKEAVRFMRASLPATINIRHNVAADTGMALAHPTQIHQIVFNLCANASYAMRERGGLLEICLANMEIGPPGSKEYPHVKPGSYITLTVRDTGEGMEPAVLERSLEPYYTTKPPGEGSGLGLAVVHGIVKRCGGEIDIRSEPGRGATFRIFLPRVVGEPARSRTNPDIPRGTESILLIDDEVAVVDTTRAILTRLGYRVVGCYNGGTAMEALQSRPEHFDMVITDCTMPGISGLEIVRKIKDIRADIPIILCTGFNESISEEQAMNAGVDKFAFKPLTRRRLAEIVRGALDRKKQADNSPR